LADNRIEQAKSFCRSIDAIVDIDARKTGKRTRTTAEIDLLIGDLKKPVLQTFYNYADGEMTCLIPLPDRLSGYIYYSGRTNKWHTDEYRTLTPPG